MPTSLNKYRVKDLPRLTDPAQLLGKIMEVESTTTDQSSSVTMPLVIQTVADNLPASKKVTRLLARTFDTTDPNYLSGDPTLVSQSLASDLVMYMTAGVEFPALEYRLKPDPNGPLLAYRDTTFAGPKLGARWVIAGSADDNSFPDFSPFTAVYPQGAIVKYTLGGQLRLFSAQQELVAVNIPGGQQLPPTGLVTDPNWTEVNGEAAPNYSRLGQLVCRYYTNAERAADPYPVGDTVEELTAREVAGAGILYSGRTVRVELGPNAGTYHVVYAPTAPEYQAYIDGSFSAGQNPSKWELIPAGSGDVTQAYVDAGDAALGTRIDAASASAAHANDRLDTLVANAPQALDTLKEISDQLAADEQGTAAILAKQQEHTQQLANAVHRTGDESIYDRKTFTANTYFGDSIYLGSGTEASGIKIRTFDNNGSYLRVFDVTNVGTANSVNFGAVGGGGDLRAHSVNYRILSTDGQRTKYVLDDSGNSTQSGTVSATYFVGDGSRLTNLPGGPANTDALPEGSTNRYYTNSRAALKADLVNGAVPGTQLPNASIYQKGALQLGRGLYPVYDGTVSIGTPNYNYRITAVNGVFNVRNADWCYATADTVLNLDSLNINEVFAIGTSLYSPIADFLNFRNTQGTVVARLPAGFTGTYRKTDTYSIALISIASQLPSYAQAFVPDAIKSAVTGGVFNDNNELTDTPANSEPSMRFFDAKYIYDCYLTAQVTNGVLTKTWIRTPKTAPVAQGGGGGTTLTSTDQLPEGSTNRYFTDARAQSALGGALAAKADLVNGAVPLAQLPYKAGANVTIGSDGTISAAGGGGSTTVLPPVMMPLVMAQGAPIATTSVDTGQASSIVIGSDFLWDSAYAVGKTVLLEICCSASAGKTLAASLYTLDGANVSGSGISGFTSSPGLARTGTFTLVHGTTYQVRIAIGSSGTGYLYSARLIIK